MRRFTITPRTGSKVTTGNTSHPSTWLLTCLLRLSKFEVKTLESTTLSHRNQGTRFKEFPTYENDARPIETGDHLITLMHEKQKAFHNMLMWCTCTVFIDPTNKPVAEKKNNGLDHTETEQEYTERFSEKTPRNWALAITDDINCFAIQEGVVAPKHLPLFKKGIQKHLPDWELRGGTEFGLYFLVRKEYAKQYAIDHNLPLKLEGLKLNSRCLTLVGPTEKVSNIHVPHGKPETSYKKIMHVILEDMIDQLNPKKSERILFEIAHTVSDKEHLKDGKKRRTSVSGATEIIMRCGDKMISHTVLGDFNLELNERQKLDQAVFSEIKEKVVFEWAFKTITKNAKYIAGLFIGGSMTLSADFAAVDEAGVIATALGRKNIAFFAEKVNVNIIPLASAFAETYLKIIDCDSLPLQEGIINFSPTLY